MLDISDNVAAFGSYQTTSADAGYQFFAGSPTDFELAFGDAIDENALVAEAALEIYGLHGGLMRLSTRPGQFVFHATDHVQSVLDKIDPVRLNPDSRFGPAFYVSESAETAVAEMAHYRVSPKFGIRFELSPTRARVLDLTDPDIARAYGYAGGEISESTKAIGSQALSDGYNVSRYPSLRAEGVKLAILADFDDVIIPIMVGPINANP